MITAMVKSPTTLSVDYVPKTALISGKPNNGKVIGILNVSGYAPTTTGPSLRFSDSAGVSGRLTLTSTISPENKFQARMILEGSSSTSPWINKGPGNLQGTLPEKVSFHIKVSDATSIPAGQYTDIINITARNQ